MRTLIKIVAFLLVAGLIALGAVQTNKVLKERKAKSAPVKRAATTPRVFVHKIQSRDLERTLMSTGEVRAFAEVNVVSKITGRLEKLRLPDGKVLEVGDEVKMGDVIAIIERSALEAAVKKDQAAVGVAKASLERAKVNLDDSEREKKRAEDLFTKGASSEQKRDQAVITYERSVAEMSLVKSQIEQAEAALFQSDVNLKEATITAPTSGTISQKFLDEGNMVGLGTPLVKISQIDTVKIMSDISERHLALISPGKTIVHILSDSYPDLEFNGTVFQIGIDLDSKTRTAPIEIRIPNPEKKLRPGMFTRVSIVLEKFENVPVVPDAALIHREGKVFVYTLDDKKVKLTEVSLGISEGDYHHILKGLSVGDVVLVSGQRLLKDGDAVEIAEETKR